MASGRRRELSSLPGLSGRRADVTPWKGELQCRTLQHLSLAGSAFLLQKYGMLFLRGTGMTLLIAHDRHGRWAFVLGLLVAIVRTIALPEKNARRRRMRA